MLLSIFSSLAALAPRQRQIRRAPRVKFHYQLISHARCTNTYEVRSSPLLSPATLGRAGPLRRLGPAFHDACGHDAQLGDARSAVELAARGCRRPRERSGRPDRRSRGSRISVGSRACSAARTEECLRPTRGVSRGPCRLLRGSVVARLRELPGGITPPAVVKRLPTARARHEVALPWGPCRED